MQYVRELQSIARAGGTEVKVSAALYPEKHPLAGKEYMIGYSVMLRGHREVLAAIHYPYTDSALYTVWPLQGQLFVREMQRSKKEAA